MHTRQFGTTDMNITPLGVGAWAIGGGGWEHGWGPQDDTESIGAIKRALNLGLNWIDTAAVYGLGHSEEVVGKAIKGREKPYIFTKCSLVWDEKRKVTNSLTSASIQHEVESSLKRLGIEAIDLYQIHWPNPDRDLEEGWSTLARLKKEGKIRHIGVSNFNVEQLERAQKIAPVETVQPPYSLVNPDADKEILPYCHEHNIGVIVYSPMASGLLSGFMSRERIEKLPSEDWRKKAPQFQEPRLSRNLELVNVLGEIAFPHNVSAGVVAIAWALHNPAVTAAIVGVRRAQQIEDLVAAAEFRLDAHELAQIEQFLQKNP